MSHPHTFWSKLHRFPSQAFPILVCKLTKRCSPTTNEGWRTVLLIERLKEETVLGPDPSQKICDRCLRPKGLVRAQAARTGTNTSLAPSGMSQLLNSCFYLISTTRFRCTTAGAVVVVRAAQRNRISQNDRSPQPQANLTSEHPCRYREFQLEWQAHSWR